MRVLAAQHHHVSSLLQTLSGDDDHCLLCVMFVACSSTSLLPYNLGRKCTFRHIIRLTISLSCFGLIHAAQLVCGNDEVIVHLSSERPKEYSVL
jgi:hypothetical protein